MENATLLKRTTVPATPAKTVVATAVPRVYFKHFDGIRFFAALLVMFQHLSNYKADLSGQIPNAEQGLATYAGFHGVTLFFVLSGFLIFYLLFTEKKYTGTVAIKDFYIRRILRIWPLYLGFGLASILGIESILSILGYNAKTNVGENLVYLSLFAVNLQLLFGTINRGIIELYWSVCIEEQFYLIAPWLIKKKNSFLKISFSLIAIGILTKIALHYLLANGIIHMNQHTNPVYIFTTSWFDAFGFGVLAAYILYNQEIYEKVKHLVEHKLLQGVVVLFTLLYILDIIPRPQFLTNTLFSTIISVPFAFLILAAASGKFLFNLETPFLKRLGKYSYGMYVLHSAILQVVLWTAARFIKLDNTLFYEVLYPLLSVSLVIIASGLSYELYEQHFLKLKRHFTVVQNKGV